MKDYIYVIIAIGAALIFVLAMLTKRITALYSQRREDERTNHSRQTMLPLRIQAYERLTILMERLSPEELLLRYNSQVNTVGELQLILLSAVRSEYEHNVAQQIYVSPTLWNMLTETRNTLLTIINQSAVELAPNAPAYELSKRIMDNMTAFPSPPTVDTLRAIRREAQAVLG